MRRKSKISSKTNFFSDDGTLSLFNWAYLVILEEHE